MGSDERTSETRDVTWSGSTNSNTVQLRPGATFSLYLDGDFAGSSITIEDLSTGTARAVNDPEAQIPVTATASAVNILPAAIYASGLSLVQFVSDSSETCTGELLMSR